MSAFEQYIEEIQRSVDLVPAAQAEPMERAAKLIATKYAENLTFVGICSTIEVENTLLRGKL